MTTKFGLNLMNPLGEVLKDGFISLTLCCQLVVLWQCITSGMCIWLCPINELIHVRFESHSIVYRRTRSHFLLALCDLSIHRPAMGTTFEILKIPLQFSTTNILTLCWPNLILNLQNPLGRVFKGLVLLKISKKGQIGWLPVGSINGCDGKICLS